MGRRIQRPVAAGIPGITNMAKNEKTSPKAATAASKTLKNKGSSKDAKTAAGSALSQAPDKKGNKK